MKKKFRLKKRIIFGVIGILLLLLFWGDIRSTTVQTIRILNNKINRMKNEKKNLDGEVLWISNEREGDNNKPVKESYCVWPYYEFDKAVDKATTIVRGKVMSRSTETKGLPIYNQDGTVYDYDYYREVTVEIVECLKGGEVEGKLIYKEPGGESENYVHQFHGVDPLELGAEYIFFLVENNTFLNPSTVIPILDEKVTPSSELMPENLSSAQTYGVSDGISVSSYIEAIKAELN